MCVWDLLTLRSRIVCTNVFQSFLSVHVVRRPSSSGMPVKFFAFSSYSLFTNNYTNPACGKLNKEIEFPLSPFAPENVVSRDRLSRPASARLFSTTRLNILTHGLLSSYPLCATAFIYTADRHRISPEFIELPICLPTAFTAVNPPAQSQ